MGLKRIGGRAYFYRSVRDGARVRSEYVAAGRMAEAMANLEAERRESLRADREAERTERQAEVKELGAVVDWFDQVEAVANAAFEVAGFHKHRRGEWRRRRNA